MVLLVGKGCHFGDIYDFINAYFILRECIRIHKNLNTLVVDQVDSDWLLTTEFSMIRYLQNVYQWIILMNFNLPIPPKTQGMLLCYWSLLVLNSYINIQESVWSLATSHFSIINSYKSISVLYKWEKYCSKSMIFYGERGWSIIRPFAINFSP